MESNILRLLILKKVYLWNDMRYITLKNLARMYGFFQTDYLFKKHLKSLVIKNKMKIYKKNKGYHYLFLNLYEKEYTRDKIGLINY
tara:strand:+ start:531 stop:788 length:258 start_codon:yes stop_codon:yes gene_type:complete